MAKTKCSNCGAELDNKNTICPNCGTKKEKRKRKEKKEKEETSKENLKILSDEYLEKKIAVINVKTAAKEGYRDYAETVTKQKNNKIFKENSIHYFIIAILLIIIFILSIMLINSKNNKCQKYSSQNKDILNEIKIYNSRNGFITEKTSKSDYIGTIKAVDQIIHIYDGIILYNSQNQLEGIILLYKDDDKIKMYNTKTDKISIFNFKSDYEEYHLIYEPNTKEVFGISYIDGVEKENDNYIEIEYSGYYDLNQEKEIYVGKGFYDFKYVTQNKIKAKKGLDDNINLVLLDTTKEKIDLSNKYDSYNCGSIDYIGLTSEYIISGTPGCIGKYMTNATIYDNQMKVIIEEINENEIEIYNNDLYVRKNDKIYRYTNGNKKYESNKYDKVLDIINDYFIVVENNQLKITNENNINIFVTTWENNYEYHQLMSDYKYQNELPSDKKEGIYLIIQKGENINNIEYYFNPVDNSVKEYSHNDLTM